MLIYPLLLQEPEDWPLVREVSVAADEHSTELIRDIPTSTPVEVIHEAELRAAQEPDEQPATSEQLRGTILSTVEAAEVDVTIETDNVAEGMHRRADVGIHDEGGTLVEKIQSEVRNKPPDKSRSHWLRSNVKAICLMTQKPYHTKYMQLSRLLYQIRWRTILSTHTTARTDPTRTLLSILTHRRARRTSVYSIKTISYRQKSTMEHNSHYKGVVPPMQLIPC